MNIMYFPEEILIKILSFCDWKSIIMFLSTNKYNYENRSNKKVLNIIKLSYFGTTDLKEFKESPFYSILEKADIHKKYLNYKEIVKKMIKVEQSYNYLIKVSNTLSYVNESINLLNNYSDDFDIDVTNLTFINLDFLNNYLISSINEYGIYTKNNRIVYDIIISLIYFEKKLITSSLYTSLYTDLIMKNLPTLILTLLKNKFLTSDYIRDTMCILREYYLINIFDVGINVIDDNYDLIDCYFHVIKNCIIHKNNKKENIDLYIEEIEYLIELVSQSQYKIQLIKYCFNLYKFIVYYFRNNITPEQLNKIIQSIKNLPICDDLINIIEHNVGLIIDIISYADVTGLYYEYLLILLNKLKTNDIYIGNYLKSIICIGKKREIFINGWCKIFINELELIINSKYASEKNLLDLTTSIIDEMYFINSENLAKLLKFSYNNLQDNKNSLDEYIEYMNNIDDIDINTIPQVKSFHFDEITFDLDYNRLHDKYLKPPSGFNTY